MRIDQVVQSIDDEIARLRQARALLSSSEATSGRTRSRQRRGPMSAAAKAKIAAAQRARWARVKAIQKTKKK